MTALSSPGPAAAPIAVCLCARRGCGCAGSPYRRLHRGWISEAWDIDQPPPADGPHTRWQGLAPFLAEGGVGD
jgi:hypothetical protein